MLSLESMRHHGAWQQKITRPPKSSRVKRSHNSFGPGTGSDPGAAYCVSDLAEQTGITVTVSQGLSPHSAAGINPAHAVPLFGFLYHRLTRANTPASAPLRRFLPFSPWRASARLRIKSQKSLGNPSLAGAKQFCRAEMCPDKERPAGNTCRISKGLDAVWAYFCPSKPCLPLSTDGIILHNASYFNRKNIIPPHTTPAWPPA